MTRWLHWLACRRAAAAATGALILLTSPGAWAGPPTETLRDLFARAETILADQRTGRDPAERLAAVRALAHGMFDVQHAARRVLGREWPARTASEQQEFIELFGDLLERSLIFRLASVAGGHDGVRVRYLGEVVDPDGVTVLTTVASRQGADLPLAYRMVRRDERWMIGDVLIDGVSLVGNYHAQVERILEDSSYVDLVALMRAKATPAPPITVTSDEPAGVELVRLQVNPIPDLREQPRTLALSETRPAPASPEPGRQTRDRAARDETAPKLVAPTPPPGPNARQRPEASGAVLGLSLSDTLPAAPAPSYWVQVGAFRHLDLAGRLIARLPDRNLVLSFAPVNGRTGPEALLLRVRLGPFADRARALARLHELRARGYQPALVEGDE